MELSTSHDEVCRRSRSVDRSCGVAVPTTLSRQECAARPALESPRADWVDRFKGVVIVLVVVGHVIGGLHTAGIVSDRAMLLYRWIYAFHMPAMFFAAGLFARRSLRGGYRGFLGKKLQTIAYPYFLWGILTWASEMLMLNYVNNQPDPSTPLRLLYCPEAGPWFLYILFLIFLAFAGISRLGLPRLVFFIVSAVLYALGIAGVFQHWSAIDLTSNFLIYFALGVAVDREAFQWAESASPRCVNGLFLVSLILLSLFVWFGLDEQRGMKILPALAGIVGLYALSCGLALPAAGEFLRLCGVMSLEIYVLHPFPSVLGRTVLLKVFKIHSAWTHIAVGVTLGVCGPIAVAWLCRRLDFPYLFRWGRAARRVPLQTQVGIAPLTGLEPAAAKKREQAVASRQ